MIRILIVELNPDVRLFLEIAVERLAYEPVDYYSVAPDLAHLDAAIVEPTDENGFEIAKALRDRDVKVIFASIYPATPKTLALQPVAYLVKPFARHALDQALAQALALGNDERAIAGTPGARHE